MALGLTKVGDDMFVFDLFWREVLWGLSERQRIVSDTDSSISLLLSDPVPHLVTGPFTFNNPSIT